MICVAGKAMQLLSYWWNISLGTLSHRVGCFGHPEATILGGSPSHGEPTY